MRDMPPGGLFSSGTLSTYDVIVVGIGSMGSAACYHLAKRGLRVLGLEQFDVPHERGSHHGHSRMIRRSYFEHPDYVPLLRRAYQLWDELEEVEGSSQSEAKRLFHRTGGLYLGPPDGAVVPGALQAAREHGLSHELLDRAELARRFPAFRAPVGFSAFYEVEAGFLVPELAVAAHARQAIACGAEIRTREEILDWETKTLGVSVRTGMGRYEAAHLVVTAGAWSGSLLRDLEVELTVTRQVLAWFDAQGDRESLALGNFPCWFIESDPPYGHYGFPMLDSGQRGLKIGLHKPGAQIAPDALGSSGAEATNEETDSLREILGTCIPDGVGPLLVTQTCLYTNSADDHFIIGPHPSRENLTFAAGFSGHGFKFSSVMGEVLADLASEGTTRHPIEFLSPRRFG